MDLLRSGRPHGGGSQDEAADAGVLVDAQGVEVTCADAQRNLPQLEVGQEVPPLLRGGLFVLAADRNDLLRAMKARWWLMTSSG
ncbi:hypothetical protein [Streptomyces sp. ADI96-02]|uniref:hypothetical protein n=1 Tax=Streptomyces sp. ADI96-02 TaxID=1522760 RepID=UPI0013DDA256|nr:hypothetical protein [Streptomyces sp. ADI96-02]